MSALREVLRAGAAKAAVAAVPPAQLDQAVPLFEAALAAGPDVDIELVPSDEPGTLLEGPWLAVAPRDRSWHDGAATAVWHIGPVPGPEGASGPLPDA